MKRYDTVYFLHKSITGRIVPKAAMVVSNLDDGVMVQLKDSKKIMVLDKSRLVSDKKDLPDPLKIDISDF